MNPRAMGIAALALTLASLPLFAGEEFTHEDALKQMIQSLGKMTATLGSVKDADSAQAARPELKKLVGGFVAVRAKADKLPPPEPAEKERLAKQYKGKMDDAIKKLLVEAGRLESVVGTKELLKDLRGALEPPPAPK